MDTPLATMNKNIIIPCKKLVKRILWELRGGYKPKEFWETWSKTFLDDPWQRKTHEQHQWMVRSIKKIKPKSILEVGCGFGRNIKFLIDNGISPIRLTGCDISQGMIDQAKKYIHSPEVTLLVADVNSLTFKNNSFDLVFAHGVCMHLKPQDIRKAIQEMKRVSQKHVLIIEQNYKADNQYTFVHPYEHLWKEQSLKIIDSVHNAESGLDYFLLEK